MKQLFFKHFLPFLLCLLLLTACGAPPAPSAATPDAPTWQSQYDLGLRLLSEGNYEEAIIAFTAAIEIDPKQVAAHIGLSDAYIGLKDFTAAETVLLAAKEQVSAEDITLLEEKLSELKELATAAVEQGSESSLNGSGQEAPPLPESLNGMTMFTHQDLIDWGVPYGSTIWEIAERFDYSQEDIDAHFEWIEEMKAEGSESVTFVWKNGVGINDSGIVTSIHIETDPGKRRTILPSGPRGLALGMTFREVLDMFLVANMAAYDCLMGEKTDKTIEIYHYQSEESRFTGYAGRTKPNGSEGAYACYTEVADGRNVNIMIHFTDDGVVYRIVIHYIFEQE